MPEDFLLDVFPAFRAECGRVGKIYGFCKAHFRRICSLLTPKENQKSASDFDALDPRKRGCSPLLTPKKKAPAENTGDSRLFGVKISSPYFRLPPILSRCATTVRPTAAKCRPPLQPLPREKAIPAEPQLCRDCKYKKIISADIARAKRRQFKIVYAFT